MWQYCTFLCGFLALLVSLLICSHVLTTSIILEAYYEEISCQLEKFQFELFKFSCLQTEHMGRIYVFKRKPFFQESIIGPSNFRILVPGSIDTCQAICVTLKIPRYHPYEHIYRCLKFKIYNINHLLNVEFCLSYS